MLFAFDFNPDTTWPEVNAHLAREIGFGKLEKVAREWIAGVREQVARLDEVISEAATNWSLQRMPAIDRNILRLAVFELKLQPETPPKVVINEAIELTKKFSTGSSSRFVNGVLDRISGLRRGTAPLTLPISDPTPPVDAVIESTDTPPDAS
jgi:N utilization substance protein B